MKNNRFSKTIIKITYVLRVQDLHRQSCHLDLKKLIKTITLLRSISLKLEYRYSVSEFVVGITAAEQQQEYKSNDPSKAGAGQTTNKRKGDNSK